MTSPILPLLIIWNTYCSMFENGNSTEPFADDFYSSALSNSGKNRSLHVTFESPVIEENANKTRWMNEVGRVPQTVRRKPKPLAKGPSCAIEGRDKCICIAVWAVIFVGGSIVAMVYAFTADL